MPVFSSDIQDLIPGLSAIDRLIYAARSTFGPGRSLNAGIDHLRVVRVYNDAVDVAGVFEADVGPGMPPINGFVHAVARVVAIPGVAFAGAYVNDVWILLINRDIANRMHILRIEERFKGDAAIV